MSKSEQLIQRFTAHDAQGRAVQLCVWQTVIQEAYRGGVDVVRGMKRLATLDGHAVNVLEKGRYRIVATNQIVTSDGPDAPGDESPETARE